MSTCIPFSRRAKCAAVAAVALCLASAPPAQAQVFRTGAVGGVFIDTNGALNDRSPETVQSLHAVLMKAFQKVPGDLNQPAPLRKVSLRRLEEAIQASDATGAALPDDIKYLAGLQRIQFVFVDREHNDIILAGPADGWKLDARGNIVGITSGRPVLLLDDLLVALRTAEKAAQGGLTCSIDPTKEGLASLQDLLKQVQGLGPNPKETINAIEKSLGPQNITLNGVPETSHFARVMVAADYRMKRLAMGFENSPVSGMPNFLSMVPARGLENMMPRWWLVPEYDPLHKDADGLAWELRGRGVRCLTEDSVLGASGQLAQSGKASPAAQRWADTFTEKYEELSVKEPIFGELRNIIDMAVVAALIVKEGLKGKADYAMPLLMNAELLKTEVLDAPRRVASKASTIKKGKNRIISVSGGVEISSWQVLEKAEAADSAASARQAATAAASDKWWWN